MTFRAVETLLSDGLRDSVFGAVGAGVISKKGKWTHLLGKTRNDPKGEEVSEATLFDLASLTKPFLTGGVASRLVERGELLLDKRITEYLSDLPWHTDWSDVTVGDVLAHRAGFCAWYDFSKESPEHIPSQIASMPTFYPPRSSTIYSDLGFILLGTLLEELSGKRLHQLLDEEICQSIVGSSLLANPAKQNIPPSRTVATEDIVERGGVIQGEVHDSNALALGGLAGHAGLFGTVEGCLNVGQAWLESLLHGSGFLPKKTAEEFTARIPTPHGFARTLGWDLPALPASAAGQNASSRTFGHLGFTGTSIWIDAEREAVVVLLTNRVHPTSKNEKIRTFRPTFHDAIWEALDS